MSRLRPPNVVLWRNYFFGRVAIPLDAGVTLELKGTTPEPNSPESQHTRPAVTLLASSSAHADCATPTRLEIDSIQFPSWSYDVGGEWTALENNGSSQGYCYKQEAGVNEDPQVMFNYGGVWYVAIAAACDSIGLDADATVLGSADFSVDLDVP